MRKFAKIWFVIIIIFTLSYLLMTAILPERMKNMETVLQNILERKPWIKFVGIAIAIPYNLIFGFLFLDILFGDRIKEESKRDKARELIKKQNLNKKSYHLSADERKKRKDELGWEMANTMAASSSEIDRLKALNLDDETTAKLVGMEIGSALGKVNDIRNQKKDL